MSSKKISQFPQKNTLNANDEFVIVDSSDGTNKKVKYSSINSGLAPDLDDVLSNGNDAGGQTIENIGNSTNANGLVNKGYIDAGLIGKEDLSNKHNAPLDASTTKYPTNNSVKTYIDSGLALKEDVSNKELSTLDTSTTKYPCNNVVKTYVDTGLSGKQNVLGFTPENVANKETSALDTSTTKYPSNNIVKTYVDAGLSNKEDVSNKETVALDNSTTKYPCNAVVQSAINDSMPKIKDLAWFQAEASTVFPEGYTFYYKNDEHPNGTGVKKVCDGVSDLYSLPTLVDKYRLFGEYESDLMSNFVIRTNNYEITLISKTTSLSNLTGLNGRTFGSIILIDKPLNIYTFHLFVASITGSINIKAKLFKLNILSLNFIEVETGTATIGATGQNYINLNNTYDAEPGIYAICFYFPSGTASFRSYTNVQTIGHQICSVNLVGDLTSIPLTSFTLTNLFASGFISKIAI